MLVHTVEAIKSAYMRIASHFPDGYVEFWLLTLIEDQPGLDAPTRYFTHKSACPGVQSLLFRDFDDPNGVLEALREGKFIHGYNNYVEYFERITDSIRAHQYCTVFPTAFKIGDVVEAVIAIGCAAVQNKTLKMLVTLRALTLIDHTERDRAAILCMRQRYTGSKASAAGMTLRCKSPYGTEPEIGNTESAVSWM
ncbi:hypothetical protein FA15DRAFT_659177 [Coprinopsis marcescibilis]|uniref:Uncharacterized protein n=1 Tax=Coprinopsis marcescibilis TaxID=230819 RepID=A0A5C3KJ74_COPMA|nr:hypothetical protein FA15DRAFT_659177 [Coprinopsis marcescibilis]